MISGTLVSDRFIEGDGVYTGVFECGHIINTHLHIYHVILHLKSWIRLSIFRNNHTFAQLGCSSPFASFRFTGTHAHLKLKQLGICSLQITHPVEIMIFFFCSLSFLPLDTRFSLQFVNKPFHVFFNFCHGPVRENQSTPLEWTS